MLCTLEQVKRRLGLTDEQTEHDTELTEAIASASSMIESYCSRKLIMTETDVTETYTGRSEYLQLDRYPVVSITSIKVALDWDFADATALVEDTDYRILAGGRTGILWRPYCDWSDTPDSIQVVYRGGYLAAGETPGEGTDEVALPAELTEAGIQQTVFLYQRKGRDIGTSGQRFEGGGFEVVENTDLLKSVAAVLDRGYRRWAA